MRDFTDRLDEQLQQLVLVGVPMRAGAAPPIASPPEVPAPSQGRPRTNHARLPRPRRSHIAAGGLGTAGIVAASAAFLAGTSAAGLPVLQTPTSDARALVKGVQLDRSIDFSSAHVVRSAGGAAAVMAVDHGARTCLAIPDPIAADTPVGGCAATAKVERAGLLVQAQPVQRGSQLAPRGAIAFILPLGASNPRMFDGLHDGSPSVEAGVVLSYTHGASRLRYQVGGRTVSIAIPGPFDGEQGTCNGRQFTPTLEPGSDAGGAPGHLIASQACLGHPRKAAPGR